MLTEESTEQQVFKEPGNRSRTHFVLKMTPFHGMTTLLLLFLVLVFSNAAPKVSSNIDGYPPMWNLVPEKLNDFNIHNGKVVINPWDYLERMGMYKILLNVTAQFLDMEEPDNKRNILWGLPLQHGWQFRTGRLEDVTKQSACEDRKCISVKSWWACMNYYLAVIPFLGAFDAGFFESFPYELNIARPEELDFDFCYSSTECRLTSPHAMNGWKAFFEYIKTSNQISDKSVPLSKEENGFLPHMWSAHVESIKAALPRCSKRLSYISAPEGNFGKNWATAVEFIAATDFPTDFQSTNEFQTFLPHRMLVDGDVAPYISDFSKQENMVLLSLHSIKNVNTLTGGLLLRLWKKAMCSEQGKAAGRNLLQNIVTDPHLAPQTVIQIIMELIKNSAC
ncbi:protein LEG1 homolog [Mixophyes fleayi]|uniref:protein LEG1 homolog n=1 Tax=Mixophyes fleayi TaxID=3061075 RepID=UPI003F4DB8B4